jgi:membrane-bound ClpP family serine protease
LVRVPLPIRGSVDLRVKRMIDQLLSELPAEGTRPIVVLEFWPPDDGGGEGSEFERALSLARYLASQRLSGVRTVAYLPRTVKGHAVLVVLACEEIIMHPDAKLGAAGIREPVIDPTVRRGYSEIADRRRTIPAAVALGMLDPKLKVQQITTASGTRYVLADEVEAIRQTTTIQAIETLVPTGETGLLLSGDKLRLPHGFVSHLATNRRELAVALNLGLRHLEIDPSLGGQWQAIRLDLHGPVTAAAVNRVMRGLDDRQRQQPLNFVCLSIDSPGGSPKESIRLATYLAGLDATKIRTVSYVVKEARADAAIVATACDQLVMHDDAVLGGPGAYQMSQAETEMTVQAIREIAAGKSQRWSLVAAMFDPALRVHRYALRGSDVSEYFCEEELRDALRDLDRWEKKEEVTAAGRVLQLDGQRAEELGLARFLVSDFDEFRQQYQLEEDPDLIRPNWAHELVHALASPQVAAALLFIGAFALIAELAAPGVGVGGFVAALCFLLFFWSTFLQGTAGWLELVLFVGGLVFVGLEIFVLPGFGIFGFGGGAMILASLLLASQTFVWPRNDYQLQQLPRSLMTVAAALAGLVCSAILLRRYMGRTPLLSRVLLSPPAEEDLQELRRREALVDYTHLIGQRGVTTTQLTPCGKAEIAGSLVDVISEGELIPRGSPIVVTQASGNRVVVSQAS